ncbi:uncharacterized protein [Centruroides vittatus]|uniref:uncharacterized protein n=1 Tax=Centruroides vittatus TaxID=120091 RepID=UPI00350EB800
MKPKASFIQSSLSSSEQSCSSFNNNSKIEEKKCSEEKINPEQADEKINPEQTDEKINPEQADEKINPEQTDEKINPEQAEEKINPEQAEEKINPEQADEKINPEQADKKINPEQADEKINPEQTEEKIDSDQVKEQIGQEQRLNPSPVRAIQQHDVKYCFDESNKRINKIINIYNTNIYDSKNIRIGEKVSETDESKQRVEKFISDSKGRLKHYYRTKHAYMRSLLWEGRGYNCSVKDYFIELIVEKGKLRSSPEEKNIIKLCDIFLQLPEEDLQKFLIIGDPGYGKTTLCKKLAYDWAISADYLKHFDFVVVVTLCDIKEKSIIETILKNGLEKITIEEIKEFDLNFLIILDGYDEVRNNQTNVLKFIEYEYQNISSKMTIIVTSRPHFVPEDVEEEMEDHFSINGFDKNNQLKYIKTIFQNNNEKIQCLTEQLNQNEFLFNIAKCPLMLYMMCCFEKANYLSELKRLTDLYIKMLQLIMKRSSKKNDLCEEDLKHGRYFYGEALLIKLGELAWNYLQNNDKITFDSIKTYFPDDNEYKVVIGLDILIPSAFIIEGKEIYKYDPLHRSFFEFLSSLYLSTLKKLPPKIKKIPDINYIFLSGLCDDEPLPTFCKTIRLCDKREYNIPFLQTIYKEMKENEENFRKFCSPINVLKVNVITDNIDILEKVINCEKLKTLILILPESWNGLEPIRDKLIKINFNYCNLQCFLYAGYKNAKEFASCFDIRDSISTILYIIGNIECKHLKVYLSGSYNIDTKTFQEYKSIIYLSPVPPELQNAFDFNKTEAIIIEGKNKSSFLISCELYDVLQKEGLFLPIFGAERIDILRRSNT